MINWKLRLKNKTTLTSILIAILTTVYTVLDALAIVPKIPFTTAKAFIYAVIGIAVSVGIITDPTTPGVKDSKKAMEYAVPGDDNLDKTVGENPISDDTEEVKTEEKINSGNYFPSDDDALK